MCSPVQKVARVRTHNNGSSAQKVGRRSSVLGGNRPAPLDHHYALGVGRFPRGRAESGKLQFFAMGDGKMLLQRPRHT
jgi:hypothetical protein